MQRNILGETLIYEDTLTLLYKGDSFGAGKVKLKPLYTELRSIESLLRKSVEILIESGKLDGTAEDFEIYIQIEKGSLLEKLNVVFKHPSTIPIISTIVVPFLVATYTHFLDAPSTESSPFKDEIHQVITDDSFKSELQGVLSPLGNDNDVMMINNGTINFTIDASQRGQIEANLQGATENDEQTGKNGEFEETLTGVIRKIDLDAPGQNYLGFNIDQGVSRIPTSIDGPFNLLDYKEIINAHVEVIALVRYKNDVIKHITIKSVSILEKQGKLEM